MMKNKFVFLILITALIVTGILLFHWKKSNFTNESRIISMKGRRFLVESAVTSDEKSRGLGMRDNLCRDCGMMFEFAESGTHAFWMKDMRFPIDIIWMQNGKVVHIEKSVPADSKVILKPLAESDNVLEVNAGSADEIGLKVGDRIEF